MNSNKVRVVSSW